MSRIIAAALAMSLAACTAPRSPQAVAAAATGSSRLCNPTAPSAPLFFVDGRESTCRAVEQLPEARIARVEVLKGQAAVSAYGPRGRNGIILVTTKANP